MGNEPELLLWFQTISSFLSSLFVFQTYYIRSYVHPPVGLLFCPSFSATFLSYETIVFFFLNCTPALNKVASLQVKRWGDHEGSSLILVGLSCCRNIHKAMYDWSLINLTRSIIRQLRQPFSSCLFSNRFFCETKE